MDRSMCRRVLLILAVSSLILLMFLATAEANVGYSINVDVSGTKWSRSQVTEVLNYIADSECTGTGNSSKYVNVPGFSGIGLKELTYTKYGKLSNQNKLNVTAKLNWIYIDENIDDQPAYNETITDENGTNIIITRAGKSHYNAEINESIPTLIRSDDETYYTGLGIYSRNGYKSGEDQMCTNYYATNLSKAARFAGVYSNDVVLVDITPGRVYERILENSATALRLQSISDKYSRLKFQSGRFSKFNNLVGTYSDEEYVGKFRIDRRYSRRSTFNLSRDEYWLGCCYPEAEYLIPEDWNCKCIFDAQAPIPYSEK